MLAVQSLITCRRPFTGILRTPYCGFVSRSITTKSCDPLRILFCGSDDFSIASLKAVNELRKADQSIIRSIDVVSKVSKPYGRGLKKVRDVPIVKAAQQLNLPLHQIDTFTNWQPPKPSNESINLIIAVSFGLLVPPRILNGAEYGGLNVHPSMLPEFRGPAPVHWTLIENRDTTGVTLQTLHPNKMDHGHILLQSPAPGLPIPNSDSITAAELTDHLAKVGAEMLVEGLKSRIFAPPLEPIEHNLTAVELHSLKLAPKITPDHRRVRWNSDEAGTIPSWAAKEILRRHRVIGPLWNEWSSFDTKAVEKNSSVRKRRIIWTSGFDDDTTNFVHELRKVVDVTQKHNHGRMYFWDQDDCLYIPTSQGEFVRSKSAQLDGGKEQPVKALLNHFGMKPLAALEGVLETSFKPD